MPKFQVCKVYKFQKDFSDRFDEEDAKKRYFLYLGNTSEFLSNPVIIYAVTSTTQLDKYKPGGEKYNSNFLEFKAGTYGFTDDCVICFDEIKNMSEAIFESYQPEEKGIIDDKDLIVRIYDKILQSRKVSKIVKDDIHNCFNTLVMGLKRPK